jgi:hypothetical protein
MQQLSICQRPRVCLSNTIENLLLPTRLINWKVCRAFELTDRTCCLCTFVDESNDFNIQLVNLLSPVGDIHPIAFRCSGAGLPKHSLQGSCTNHDNRRIALSRSVVVEDLILEAPL